MWPNRQTNYQIPQEEDTLSSPQPMPAHQPNTAYGDEVPGPEDEEFNRSASLDMAFVLLSVSCDTYTASQTTENTRLRCDCTEMMSMQAPEFVITRNIVPRRAFPHLAPDVPYYPSLLDAHTEIRNSTEDAGSSRQSEYIEEERQHLDISTPTQDLSEPHHAVATIDTRPLDCHTSTSVHTDVSPPPERLLGNPVPYTLRVRCLASMPRPSSAAMQVANRVISYARAIRNAREEDVSCLNCGYYPVCPITGQCGHTRCAKCIQDTGKCPCGNGPPESLYVNVLIQDLIKKAESETPTRTVALACSNLAIGEQPSAPAATAFMTNERLERVSESRSGHGAIRRTRAARAHGATPYASSTRRVPISLQARYNYALKLLAANRYLEAAPHLALAAGSCQPGTRAAHTLLAQVITILCKDQDPRRFNRQLNRSVRQLLSTSWVKLADMECILCSETFMNPVTTPCGHTFCRICIERTLDYGKRCPLCLRSLQGFNLNATRETVFVQAALASVDALHVPVPLEPDLIPIFVCTVAYPSVPCPLFIFDPRHWLMIRRVLESGARKFGMLYGDRDCRYANIGTILEVRDCVHFEDGRSILSTVGVSRFRVIEKSVRDGCDVARIRPINDVSPIHYRDILDLRMMGNEIVFKAVTWLMQINPKMLDDIETTFGGLPRDDIAENWWETADGPAWLWWLVAVLPLRSQIKVLILATDCLLKRMMAVLRTLDTLVPEPVAVAARQ